MDKVSIIVPVYNVEAYLDTCIESIIKQTYPEWELILIDDGSPDNSGKICDKFSSQFEEIRVIHKKNEGVSAARKDGVTAAQGKWIMFVDGDDTIASNAVETLVSKSGDYDIINACIKEVPANVDKIHRDLGAMDNTEAQLSILMGGTYANPVASIIRKSLFRESSFLFPPDIKIGEDVLMKLELSSRATKVLNIRDVVYFYQYNNGSAMRTYVRTVSYYIKYYDYMARIVDNRMLNKVAILKLNSMLTGLFENSVSYENCQYDLFYNQYSVMSKTFTLPIDDRLKCALNRRKFKKKKDLSYVIWHVYNHFKQKRIELLK